jgi:hypothetical protein
MARHRGRASPRTLAIGAGPRASLIITQADLAPDPLAAARDADLTARAPELGEQLRGLLAAGVPLAGEKPRPQDPSRVRYAPLSLLPWPPREFAPSGLSMAHIHRYWRVFLPPAVVVAPLGLVRKGADLQAETN